MKQKSSHIAISEHLYQIYPNIPKYANDPQQSDIIRVYDLLLKRFQGIYGREPKYFIRSPASCALFGLQSQSVKLPLVTFCSIQNVVICLAQNGHQQIRFNHYQSAVYGQKIFENESAKWKYDNNDDYRNLLVSCLKSYCSISNSQNLVGLDILIYDDFIQDEHLKWRQSICCGIITSLVLVHQNKNSVQSLTPQFYYKFLQKISNFVANIKPNSFSSFAQYGNLNIVDTDSPYDSKMVQFPKNIDIIIAHSMTPLPKKMTKGKRENLRACQIQIGIQIIKNQIGATSNISSLNELKTYFNCTTQELLDTLEQYVPKGELTIQKVQQLTEKSLIENVKSIPYANNVIDENLTFKPYNRMKFCIQQQLIIQKLTSDNLDSSIQKSYLLSKELLDIGSQQFDEIINIASKYASSWKVIGQGWGGYLLLFCEQNKSKHLVDELIKQFYMAEKNRVLLSDDVQQYVKIVGKPANGLKILDPQSQIWYC